MEAVFYIAPAALENEAEVGKQFVAAAKQASVRRVVFSSVIHAVLSNHTMKMRKARYHCRAASPC
jgi:hypothetical protein